MIVIHQASDKVIPVLNSLCYGDNLHMLRDHISDESVNLVPKPPSIGSNLDVLPEGCHTVDQ